MPLPATLRLTLDVDPDGTAELFVDAEHAGFAGRSSAWFGLARIEEFARCLSVCPLDRAQHPRLAGGYWGGAPSDRGLDQEHVFLEVRPAGPRGTLWVAVRLATPQHDGDGAYVAVRRVALEFLTDYGALQPFAAAVAALAAGRGGEAVLMSDVTYE